MSYIDWLPPIKILNPLVTWSYRIMWQTKTMISPLQQCLWLLKLASCLAAVIASIPFYFNFILFNFIPCSRRVGDSRWWGSLTVVPAGNKAKRLSSVNHTTKAIHHHHHHHHHHHYHHCIHKVMPTYILINVQYLQNIVFSFEIGSNGQNISRLLPLDKKIPPSKISCFLLPINAIWKALFDHVTNQNHDISTTTVSLATKLGKLMTYLVGLHSDSHTIFNDKALLDHLAN